MTQPSDVPLPDPTAGEVCDVCIIGAGITGLNALLVASSYLSRSDRVVLVDSRPGAGGMWNDTYGFVRLHQPHPIFTAGNVNWTSHRAPSHLATRPEVLEHLQHCLDVARERVGIDELFGWEYVSHEEADGLVHVRLRSPDGAGRTVTARRLVKAFGHHVITNHPLETSSDRVRSTTPELLDRDSAELRADDAPIWVVGGGKTAMDTVHRLVTELPGRDVHLMAGPGTIFARRETFFPTGARRWWSGTPINTMLRQVGQRFDGTNEDEVHAWFRDAYGIGPLPGARDFFNAYLSDAELAVITGGLRSIEQEYLGDAVDRDDDVDLVLRSGRTLSVPAGTWLVNCTGSLLRTPHPYEPFVSPAGTTLSIQMRSSTTGVYPPFAGYYLTHLMFRGQLGSLGLYALDIEDLAGKAKSLIVYASMSLALHNLSLIADALPPKVLMDCGLDFDRWYPIPRRMVGTVQFLRTHRRDRAHHRRTLDTLAERFDVRGGPLLAG